jgi:hypothetical protein
MALQRRGMALLNQQCWLWGQDIKRAEGNLLLLHGFERLRAPAGQSGSSQYTLRVGRGEDELEEPLHVRLWGFGMYFGRERGIFLNRFHFLPRAAELADLWQGREMTQLRRARDLALLPAALRWVASYEGWVRDGFGAGYRRACLRDWEAAVGDPATIASAWQELASDAEAALADGAFGSPPARRASSGSDCDLAG